MSNRTVSVNSIFLEIYSYLHVSQRIFRKGWKKVKEVLLESKTNLVIFHCSFILLVRRGCCCLMIIMSLRSKFSIVPKTFKLLVYTLLKHQPFHFITFGFGNRFFCTVNQGYDSKKFFRLIFWW